MPEPFVIAIPVYPGVDLLDVAAPVEVFGVMAEQLQSGRPVRTWVLAETNGTVMTRGGMQIMPHKTFAEVDRVDLLWVPGGDPAALQKLMNDELFLDQLRLWSDSATYVTSVCEGALLLASAGLLDGCRATTHWAFISCLEQFGQVTVEGAGDGYPRFVKDEGSDNEFARAIRVTGAGVSAGLDEALELVQLIGGTSLAESVQVFIQYFPDPPVQGTLPDTAPLCPLNA
jgi:transcriptional regulator GlxA family with amidase domain